MLNSSFTTYINGKDIGLTYLTKVRFFFLFQRIEFTMQHRKKEQSPFLACEKAILANDL